MAQYIVKHGGVLSKDGNLSVGDEIELDKKELARMDPTGERFCTPEVWAKLQKVEEAAKEAIAAEAESKPEPEKPAAKPKAKK